MRNKIIADIEQRSRYPVIGKFDGIAGYPLTLTQCFTKKYGLCLNFNDDICLDKKQVQQLVKELQNWLGEVELPFNQSFAGRLTQFPIPPYNGRK